MSREESPATKALNATRWSTLFGLWLVMLLSLPRYWLAGDTTRLTLLAGLLVAVAVALFGFWRVMAQAQRQRCPAALRHLLVCLVIGEGLMLAWHVTDAAASHWAVVLSQGAALGLLLHVVVRLWRRRR
ncbi:hypothetical protein [Salinicola avicenniae]|uniref:hypothetical protein n=1 Tax=Salinicola avicenniae TaxID=2916836 RepID=UPI002074789A|nr:MULTISPECIES: hypothetical protein [unclassified Salinicola]